MSATALWHQAVESHRSIQQWREDRHRWSDAAWWHIWRDVLSRRWALDERRGRTPYPFLPSRELAVREPVSTVGRCGICGRRLDDPADPVGSVDCGGDCRRCLAECGDGDEIRNMGWAVDEDDAPSEPLAPEGHDLLAVALTVLEADPAANPLDIDHLRIADDDHSDPEIGCMAHPGQECTAVQLARKILAEAAR